MRAAKSIAAVGADAHIGPLGSCEFAENLVKNRYILRADRVVRPYGVLEIRASL